MILKAADLKACPMSSTLEITGWGWSSRMDRRTLSTRTPMLQGSTRLPEERTQLWQQRHSHGQGVGEAIRRHAYGWERDMLRLILARPVPGWRDRGHLPGQPLPQLPRPGLPHAVHQQSGLPFSLFSPRQSVGLKTLTQAVQQLEDMTGEEVDVEEGAIATAFKKVAAEELEKLYPLKATAEAHRLPILIVAYRVPADTRGDSVLRLG